CAEISKFRKIGHLVHFGGTGDEPDTLIFYFQHSKSLIAATNGSCGIRGQYGWNRSQLLCPYQYFSKTS
ncbi:MAG: hypothetical protein FWC50_16150, partial [Planctomycetaceae bacterium]|nr:hypothetical protein [Planctomycetaceae bacterium]